MNAPRTPALVRTRSEVVVIVRLLLRLHVTGGRLAALGALSALTVGLAAATRSADDPGDAGASLLAEMGLAVILPVSIAWLATSVLGELLEDRTLVYLWHTPVARLKIALAAAITTLLVIVPLVGAPIVVAAAVADSDGLVSPVAAGVAVGSFAYTGLFVAAGVTFRRGLWFALGYVLGWENGIARLGDGLARISISGYMQSFVEDALDVETSLGGVSVTASVIAPLAIGAAATLATAVVLARREID